MRFLVKDSILVMKLPVLVLVPRGRRQQPELTRSLWPNLAADVALTALPMTT